MVHSNIGGEFMPYRQAHYYLLLMAALTGLAFWPIYFSILPSASIALHIHGFSASLWIALLTFQSWSIHSRRNEWHRVVGVASLAIFPLFFAGSTLIVHTMASNFTSGDLFDGRFGARFAAFDVVAVPAIAFLYWSGLRWRRKVHLHARYMLATVLFLFEPIFSRLFLQYIPGLQVTPPEFARLPLDVELSSLGALLLALALAWKQPKHARPWLITAALVGLQMLVFPTLGLWRPWEAFVRLFAVIPATLLFSLGLAVGAAVSWFGWNSIPTRPVSPLEAAGTADA
jgi:hypothetical protein